MRSDYRLIFNKALVEKEIPIEKIMEKCELNRGVNLRDIKRATMSSIYQAKYKTSTIKYQLIKQ